jgi:hypothetical protein
VLFIDFIIYLYYTHLLDYRSFYDFTLSALSAEISLYTYYDRHILVQSEFSRLGFTR